MLKIDVVTLMFKVDRTMFPKRTMFLKISAVLTALIGGTLTLANTAQARDAAAPRTHVVEIRDFKYVPETVQVRVGDTVVWKNLDAVPHTATDINKKWDSDLLATYDQWSLQITASMHGAYFCVYHPAMQGRISIQP